MTEEMTVEQLQAELKRAQQLEMICEDHGEADGRTAMRSLGRALSAELKSRDG